MILIAHRGNVNGPNPELENTLEYINSAIDAGYECEIEEPGKDIGCENWEAIWEVMNWLRDHAVDGRCVRCGYCTKDLTENQTTRKE